MSNIRLILLVIAVLFLVVFFGRSPMDEVRKKRAERAGRQLVEKIEDANKKNKNSKAIESSALATHKSQRNTNATNPFANTNPYTRPTSNATADVPTTPVAPNAAPKDDYYPPAPKNPNIKIPLSSNDAKNSATSVASKAFADPNFITDDGKSLAFWGTKVYVYDEDGQVKPMPDGKYSMYNGKWHMVIRGGEQTIANGDTTGWWR